MRRHVDRQSSLPPGELELLSMLLDDLSLQKLAQRQDEFAQGGKLHRPHTDVGQRTVAGSHRDEYSAGSQFVQRQ